MSEMDQEEFENMRRSLEKDIIIEEQNSIIRERKDLSDLQLGLAYQLLSLIQMSKTGKADRAGLNANVKLPSSKEMRRVLIDAKEAKIGLELMWTKKKTRKTLPLMVTVLGQRVPCRYQTAPLKISRIVEFKKTGYTGNLLCLEYSSGVNQASAGSVLQDMTHIDGLVEQLIFTHQDVILPDVILGSAKKEAVEIAELYEGFSKRRKWTKPAAELPPYTQDASLTFAEDGSSSVEPGKKPRTEEETIMCEPELSFFVKTKGRKIPKLVGPDKMVIPFKALKEGMEVKVVFDLFLSMKDKSDKVSASGELQLLQVVKQDIDDEVALASDYLISQ